MILFAILIAVFIIWGGVALFNRFLNRLSTRSRRNLVIGLIAFVVVQVFLFIISATSILIKGTTCKKAIIEVAEAERTSKFINSDTFDKADINKDGCVDSEDIRLFIKDYSYIYTFEISNVIVYCCYLWFTYNKIQRNNKNDDIKKTKKEIEEHSNQEMMKS